MTYRTKVEEGRITVPSRLRTLAGLSDGDAVEVALVKGRFVVTPTRQTASTDRKSQQQFIERLRAEAPPALRALWTESKRHGTDKMASRQINAIISQVRAEQTAKNTKQSAK
jgi:bifunctional DNA-binding transcriptional regulator/antitoxin component of YhaV-PrlF toxin-antitoxin module